jgi:hypothetical protein
LSEIPKSSRTFANAVARFSPESEWGTSTTLIRRHMGSSLFLKWMVIAI